MRTPFWRSGRAGARLAFPGTIAVVLAAIGLGLLPSRPGMAASEIGARPLLAVPAENWEARQRLAATIFAPVSDAASTRTQVVSQAEIPSADGTGAPTAVQFRVDRQHGFLYLVFANRGPRGFPLDGAGTFIVKRSLSDGSFVQAKVFLQDGPGTYLRLFPDGERTLMDAWLFGQPFQTGVAIPVGFDRVLTAPLASIIDWSSDVVDWNLLLKATPGPGDARLEQIVRKLQGRLPTLRDMDDGAMDESGRMVAIATGQPAGKGGFNCSGFAKWVVDGFYAPLTGHPMAIGPLKSRNAGKANPWSARFEEEMDPWFGLDWSRGLARAVTEARTGAVPTDAQIDVRDSSRLPYVRDVGYPVDTLAFVLYLLARRQPGEIYIGSVNAPSSAISQGTPTLRQHHHVIVLFPYFDPAGDFRVAVMERNLQTSLASLDRRYGTEYVHLEHIGSEGIFDPPRIE